MNSFEDVFIRQHARRRLGGAQAENKAHGLSPGAAAPARPGHRDETLPGNAQ